MKFLIAQAARFGGVGMLGLILNLCVFAFAHAHGVSLPVCTALAFLAGTTNNFVWHRQFTFRAGGNVQRQCIVFVASSITIALVAAALLSVYVDVGVQPVIAQALSILTAGVAAFAFHRQVTFAHSPV